MKTGEKLRVTKSKFAHKYGIALGGMRYYPAFGVKLNLLAPFRRGLSAKNGVSNKFGFDVAPADSLQRR